MATLAPTTSDEQPGGRPWFRSPAAIALLLLGAVLLAASLLLAPRESTRQNGYILQAEAFLEGRLDVEPEEYVHDLAVVEGRRYVVHPPIPAVLLMPVAAAFGPHNANTQCVSLLLSVLSLWALWRIVRKLGVAPRLAVWLLAAFFGGTTFWFVVSWASGVWYFAHVVATTCLLLAILMALDGMGLAAGVFLGMAILSRQLCVYAAPFIVALLWQRTESLRLFPRLLRLAGLGAMVGLLGVFYLWINYARFGNPLDTGYAYIPLQSFLKARVEKHGLFNLAYVPFNFAFMFLQGFRLRFLGPETLTFMGMERFGTSLTFASPFLVCAFRARGSRLVIAGAWLSIAAALAHMLLYYNNGFVQHNGQRFTLDFMPVAMVLLALAAPRANPKLLKGLILYAVILNAVTLVAAPLARLAL